MSHSFDFESSSSGFSYGFEPTITAVLGEQNSDLTTKRLQRVKKQIIVKTTQTTSNMFGILDYEFALPISLQFRSVSINPAIIYVSPRNVIDASRQDSFISVGLSVSVGFF